MTLEFIFIVGLGAAVQELAYWYELRTRFTTKRVKSLYRSTGYWLTTLAMILSSPFCMWLLFGQELTGPRAQFIAGLASPMIIKKMVFHLSKRNVTRLGHSSLSEYFQLYSFGDK